MKKIAAVCLLLCSCEFTKESSTKDINGTYEIICKHPFGHIERFRIDQKNFDIPMNFRGGLWDFTTIEGTKVKATNCYSTSKSLVKRNKNED